MLFIDHKLELKITPQLRINTVLPTYRHVLMSTTAFNSNNNPRWPDHKELISIL